MIDHELAELFPPYFITATGDSRFGWEWTNAPATAVSAEMHIGAVGVFLATLTISKPTPGGSILTAEPDGLFVNLTEADKARLRRDDLLFGLTVNSGEEVGERFGQLILSDWAAEPHEGNA